MLGLPAPGVLLLLGVRGNRRGFASARSQEDCRELGLGLCDFFFGWERTPAKIVMSHMNAASPRQSLVKGERLTRYELAAVMATG